MAPDTYYDLQKRRPIPSRTHHRDASGTLHSFGGWRTADDRDPPPVAAERDAAGRALQDYLQQQARDSVNAARWRRESAR
jgi:hypothetical protein